MAKKIITKYWMMIKVDGDNMDVRQCHTDDKTGQVYYGAEIDLAQNEQTQVKNLVKSLMKKKE